MAGVGWKEGVELVASALQTARGKAVIWPGENPFSATQSPENNHLSLDALPAESRAEVVDLHCSRHSARRLAQLGIVAGAVLRKQRSAPLGGPVLVEVQGSMVALGRRLAHRVFVRVLP